MNSYLTKLIFNISIDRQKEYSQFDEQVRIVKAQNMEEAFLKARTIGKQQEESFPNKNNELVSWKFIDVIDLHQLEEIEDGEQVYAHTHETENTNSFIEFTRQKSMVIQTKFLTFA
jgi:hypothetical protein